MPVFSYASFPNSRLQPRPSTNQANTYQVQIADYTQPVTEIAAPNLDRTYIILKNLSQSTAFWYIYATPTLVDPSAVATYGVINQLLINTTLNVIYQKQDDGTTTNWTIVNIQDVGESIDPLQAASLEVISDYIYAAANSNVPVVPDILVGVDEGRG